MDHGCKKGGFLLWLQVAFYVLLAPCLFAKDKPAYYGAIQPIIYKNCTSCHRAGQCAPFPLVTYKDVSKHGATIKDVVSTGYMPPWKADTAYRKFVDQRILTKEEINLLTEWIDDGMPEGDQRLAVALPVMKDISNLGHPDLTVTPEGAFTVPGDNKDSVAYFVMRYSIPSDTNVLAFEFMPGDPKAVHHSNTWVFPEPEDYDRFYPFLHPPPIPSPVFLEASAPSVYDMFITMPPVDSFAPPAEPFHYPDFFPKVPPLYYDGWVPGTSARRWPEGFGFRLPARGIVIMQLHYGPTPVERHDQSSVNIFFTDKKIERTIESFNIGTGGGIAEPEPKLELPPDSISHFEITTEITRDQSYLALNPHMHFLGADMKAFAITPAKDTIRLVWIKQWDFRWQEFYKPLSLIKVPKGSLLKIQATFDNTARNPNNQFSPPQKVMGGANSTEEMMSLIIMSVDYREGDENIRLGSDIPAVVRKRSGTD